MVDTQSITAEDEQEPFLRYLELGQTYEQERQLNQAKSHYGEAALATQAEIAAAARASIARVAQQETSNILQIQTTARSFLQWLTQNLMLLRLSGVSGKSSFAYDIAPDIY